MRPPSRHRLDPRLRPAAPVSGYEVEVREVGLPLDRGRPHLREPLHRRGGRHRVAVPNEDPPPRPPLYPVPPAAHQRHRVPVGVRREEGEHELPHLVGERRRPSEAPHHFRRPIGAPPPPTLRSNGGEPGDATARPEPHHGEAMRGAPIRQIPSVRCVRYRVAVGVLYPHGDDAEPRVGRSAYDLRESPRRIVNRGPGDLRSGGNDIGGRRVRGRSRWRTRGGEEYGGGWGPRNPCSDRTAEMGSVIGGGIFWTIGVR
ncbi:hypothetical protein B296_00030910 [Ensete ventricosum]|uniref:Uncharacterized protein n=1 Tax=Ensete ventricosum TaxID=4639 RepID=A0A427AF67_ENSVE|nr:hypothetical protein B296_00030910 [Ensete ventricosum]